MFISAAPIDFGEVVRVIPGKNDFETRIVCEHASNRVPRGLRGPGLADETPSSHIAWDPGVPDIARDMARRMEAPLCLERSCDSYMTATDRRNPQARW